MVEETTVNAMIALNDKKAKKKRKKLDCKQDKDLALKKQRKKEKRREKQKNEKSSTNIKNKSTSTLPTTKTKDIQTNAPAKQIAFETTIAASTKKKAQAKPNGKSTLEQTAKTISKAKTPAPKKTSDVPPTIPQLQSSNPPSDIRTETTTIGTANREQPQEEDESHKHDGDYCHDPAGFIGSFQDLPAWTACCKSIGCRRPDCSQHDSVGTHRSSFSQDK